MFAVRDKTAALAFIELLVGSHAVGVDTDHEEVQVSNSPCVRAHLVSALGEKCPSSAWSMMRNPKREEHIALASYLRSVADAIDPPAVADQPAAEARKTPCPYALKGVPCGWPMCHCADF